MNSGPPEKTPKAQTVRNRFREWIANQYSEDCQTSGDCLETILVQSNRYTGRRFSIAGFSLMWMIDQSQIQLFGIDGDLLVCQAVDDFCQPHSHLKPESLQVGVLPTTKNAQELETLKANLSKDASNTTETKSPSGPAEA